MVNSDQHVNLIFGLKSEICEEHAGDEGPAEDSSSDVHEVQFGKKSGHCYIYNYICNLWEENSKTTELQRQIRTLTNNFVQLQKISNSVYLQNPCVQLCLQWMSVERNGQRRKG